MQAIPASSAKPIGIYAFYQYPTTQNLVTQYPDNEKRATFAPGNPISSDRQSDSPDYKIILFAFLDQYILAIEKE